MKFFLAFFAIFLLLGNNAMARLMSRANEDGTALDSQSSPRRAKKGSEKVSEKESAQSRQHIGQHGQTRPMGRSGQNQGQATSTAYDKADFVIAIDTDIDLDADDMSENTASGILEGTAGGDDKAPGQSTYSTPVSLSANAISSTALNRAKAVDALKKKLQAENKKKFQLHDVSGEASKNDPHQDIINKLVEASQDIEK